jgi:hypothetical protein
MHSFTHYNHLRYTIGGRLFGFRNHGAEKYEVSLGRIDKDHYRRNNYRSELIRITDMVYRDLGKDLLLFLSGGTDSEIVLRNFIEYGIKPRCVVIRFKDGYNAADVDEAIEMCKELDVKLEILDFDVKNFFYSGEASDFAKKIQCTQITYLMAYYHVYKLSAPSVMGGELLLTRYITKHSNYWYYTFRENEDASAMRFSNIFDIPLVNEWFSYTPEIMLYFLEATDAGIENLFSDPYKLTSVSSKNAILKKLYPDIRSKVKTHGFEKLLAFNYEAYKSILADSYKRLEHSLDGIPLSKALMYLRGENDY